MIERLKQLLIKHEGEVNHAYRDSEEYLTIGVGHLIDPRKGGTISHAAAMFILNEDVKEVIDKCEIAFEWFDNLNEARKIVVLNMVFNLGFNGFKKFSKTIHFIAIGDFDNAAIEMLHSTWRLQVGARALELSNMMKTGK